MLGLDALLVSAERNPRHHSAAKAATARQYDDALFPAILEVKMLIQHPSAKQNL